MSEQAEHNGRRTNLLGGVRRLLGSTTPPDAAAAPAAGELMARLGNIEQRLDEIGAAISRQATVEPPAAAPMPDETLAARMASVEQAVAALEKQIGRAGREQLKSNSLAETQLEQLGATVELLRQAATRNDGELAAARQELRGARADARLQLVIDLLPVIDGLDDALRAGRRLLEQTRQQQTRPRSIFERTRQRAGSPQQNAADQLRALESWLVGLEFVRERILNLLAAEGVEPIPAEGLPFDPRLHSALEAVAASTDAASGIITTDLRRGYRAGDRILRHSEVVVAR